MNKILLVVLGLLIFAGVAGAAPLLVEAYQEGTITIPVGEHDTVTVTEVSFSIDSACYVQLATGGVAVVAKAWLELDGENLPPVVLANFSISEGPIPIIYTCLLNPGEHTVSLKVTRYGSTATPTTCKQAYLQALIFLPDTATGAVMETPIGDTEPLPNTPSVLSSGPYVNVTGASELVDSSGRIIENAITNDKVYLSNLPTGTYFARNEERTIVKIVKVD